MNNYGIFFSYGGRVIRLPINPEELPVVREGNNQTYNVLGIGDVTISRRPKQKEVSIEGYFPGRVDSSVLTWRGFEPPEFYMNFFQAAMEDKRVLVYTPSKQDERGIAFDTQDTGFKCTVESFTTTERGGETGDFYYSLRIKEWRDYTPQQVKTRTTPQGEAAASFTPSRETPKAQLVVGKKVLVNGNFYLSSYGDEPHGTGSNLTAVISRIVTDPARQYPIHITNEKGGALGWVSKASVIPL